MKHVTFLSFLLILSAACSVLQNAGPKEIVITVLDKKTNLPVDSALVTFTTIVEARDVFPEVKYTDVSGRCRFFITPNPAAQYQANTSKKGLLSYFDAENVNLVGSFAFVNEKTDKNLVLYLTSDSMNHINYWKKNTVRYEIDSLVCLLKSNAYPLRSEFPLMLWQDIPELLANGNNKSLVNKYPVPVYSSGYSQECYMGIVSLWFIESVRIAELKKTWDPLEKFPSQTPSLRYKDNPELIPDSGEIMEKVYQAYKNWWEKIKDTGKENGCKINPLEKTNLEWR
jgi:hypothetical protein